jgi:hypothetical protein
MYTHVISTSALAGGLASNPGRFTAQERALSTFWKKRWMNLTAGLHAVEKRKFLTLPGLELRPLTHRGRNQSLFQLLAFTKSSIFKKKKSTSLANTAMFVISAEGHTTRKLITSLEQSLGLHEGLTRRIVPPL